MRSNETRTCKLLVICNDIKVSKHKVSKFEVESTIVYENLVKRFFMAEIPLKYTFD